jgi:hypothetical protein
MFGMRYRIDVAFLDRTGRVVGLCRDLAPGARSPFVRAARSALELPAGTLDAAGITEGDMLTLRPLETCTLLKTVFSFCSRAGVWLTSTPPDAACSTSARPPTPTWSAWLGKCAQSTSFIRSALEKARPAYCSPVNCCM